MWRRGAVEVGSSAAQQSRSSCTASARSCFFFAAFQNKARNAGHNRHCYHHNSLVGTCRSRYPTVRYTVCRKPSSKAAEHRKAQRCPRPASLCRLQQQPSHPAAALVGSMSSSRPTAAGGVCMLLVLLLASQGGARGSKALSAAHRRSYSVLQSP